jgi:hypothetical protein
MTAPLNEPLSIYYVTKYQLSMWTSVTEQQDACHWQQQNLTGLPESGFLTLENASEGDAYEIMRESPYGEYCIAHNLPLGTEIKCVSRIRYNTVLLINYAACPLKYFAATIESLARLLISLVGSILSVAARTVGLNRICPSRIKIALNSANKTIQSPSINLSFSIASFICLILSFKESPVKCYKWWNSFDAARFERKYSYELEGNPSIEKKS